MIVRFVSTAQFWERMCDVASIRTSRLTLANRDTLYVTLEAPEDVPGFMQEVIGKIGAALGGNAFPERKRKTIRFLRWPFERTK